MNFKSKKCQDFREKLESLKSTKILFDEDYNLFCSGSNTNFFKEYVSWSEIDFLKKELPQFKKDVSTWIVGMIVFGNQNMHVEQFGWVSSKFRYDYSKKMWVVDGDLDLRQAPNSSAMVLPDNLLVKGDLKLTSSFEKLPEYLMVKGTLWKNGNKAKHPDTMVIRGGIVEEVFGF